MPKAVKGVLVECDPSIKAIILKIDQDQHDYIVEDLDDQTMVIKESQLNRLKARLEEVLSAGEKYFEGRSWSCKSKAIYNAAKRQHSDGRWTDFPNPPDEDAVWDWLSRFQDEHLSDSRGMLYTTKNTSDLTGGEVQRQLDLIVKRRGIKISEKHDWKDVRVIGELKQSKWPLKRISLQLAMYMRDAFTAQPTRRFIHGFFLHGTTMELWVFDRSGPYSSGEFDIHDEPEKSVRAIAGYAMMDDEELGLDTFTDQDDIGRFINISMDATGKETRIQLDEVPFVKQRAVVCRGTTCFRSSDQANVVKFL